MAPSIETYLIDDMREVISGFLSEYRSAVYADGRVTETRTIRVVIPLKKFRKHLRNRIVGRRRMDDFGDPVLKALKRASVPSYAELRKKWLPAVLKDDSDAVITTEAIELTLVVPPNRNAHAR